MKRENGFFIINQMAFTTEDSDKNSFRDNALDLNKLYSKYDQYKIDKTNEYDVAYWVGERHIVIDCDTQEQTDNVLKYLKALDINTYWYYSTKEKGSAHFWFETDNTVKVLIDLYKLNAQTKVGLYKVDTRGFRESNNKKYQGAIYLRKKTKENSIQRPTPFDLMNNIEKVLPVCPIGLLVNKDYWTIPVPAKYRDNEGDPGRYSGVYEMFKLLIRKNYKYEFAAKLGIEMFKVLGYSNNDIADFTNGTYKARWDHAINNSIKDEGVIPAISDFNNAETIAEIDKQIRFFNKDYYMFAKELGQWVNLSTLSSGISTVYRHLTDRFQLEKGVLDRLLNAIELRSLVNPQSPYNTIPFFKNGYFNEEMTIFTKYTDEIPLHLFRCVVNYEYLEPEKYNKIVINWLINMFGDMKTVEDFFTNISPALCGATASTWIVLYQPSQGNAGKTSLQQMIRDVVGSVNTTKLDTSAFFEHETFATRAFKDRTYIYSEEDFTYINHTATEMIKSNINNGLADLNVNVKYSNISSIKNTLSWLSSTNSRPIFSIIDEAFTSRLLFYKINLKMLDQKDQWIFEEQYRYIILPTITNLLVEGFKRWVAKNGYTKRNKISEHNANEEIFENCWKNDIYASYFSTIDKSHWSYRHFSEIREKVDKKLFNAYKNNLHKIDIFNKKYSVNLADPDVLAVVPWDEEK